MGLELTQPVGVVGSGTMGAGIAEVAARAGHPVRLVDLDPARAAAAREGIARRLHHQVSRGRLDAHACQSALDRLTVADDLAGCGLVVEAAAENLDVKQDLFARLEAVCGPKAILATNTSSISVTAIASGLEHPERLVGMHFFNPAPVMRLVEVVSGLATSSDIADTVLATARAWGKVAVRAASVPGFIVNRVARPYYGEALRVHEEYAVSPATVDAVLTGAGGFRMGPFELMDLIGHDVNLAVSTSVWQATHHDPRYTPSHSQRELVDAGRLGRKSGRGWYSYPRDLDRLDQRDAAPSRVQGSTTPLETPVELADGALLMRTRGRTAAAEAADLDRPVVLLDLTLDPATATRVAVAASHDPSEAVRTLEAAGHAVTVLPDVPGLLVARTVAMLVNEAAELVGRSVATAEDVDLAMRHGVNYPIGPLVWGDRLGAAYVVTLLDHLSDHYRDGRYRASALLRRLALTGGTLTQENA